MKRINHQLLFDPIFDQREHNVVTESGEVPLSTFKGNIEDAVGLRPYCSKNTVTVPSHITDELAYLTGIIVGDGCVHGPINRKRGGHHWVISVTGEKEYIEIVSKLVFRLFSYPHCIIKDKRKKNCYRIHMNSIIIHRFFHRIIGLPVGKRTYTSLPEIFCETPDLFRHFLAGIIDSDGYVCPTYIAVIQKDREFLEKLSRYSKELLGITFRRPYVNRRIEGEIRGWFITLSKKDEMKRVLKRVPIKYKARGL